MGTDVGADARTDAGTDARTDVGLPCVSGAFDGRVSYVRLQSGAVFAPASVTVAVWIRPRTTGEGTVIARKSAPGGGYSAFALFTTSAHSLCGGRYGVLARFRVASGPNFVDLCAPLVPNSGAWVHLAATYDASTGAARVYVNGASAQSATSPSGARPLLYEDPAAFFTIGAELYDSAMPTSHFDGAIAQVAVFSSALAGPAIAALAASGGGADYSGAIGAWPLSDGAGSTARDTSASRADGTFVSGGWNPESTAPFCR